MVFYIVLFIYILFMYFINTKIIQKDKWIIEISTILLLILISGTRLNLGGTDYYVYESVYNSVPKLNDFIINFKKIHFIYQTYGFEGGYLFVNSLFKTLKLSFHGFTLIHSIFFYSAMYFGLKKYVYNFNYFLIIFIYKLFFYNTFISMRQSITLAFFFIALPFLEKRKFIPYLAICILAVTFHIAALILIPIYFINFIKLDNKFIVILNLLFIPSLIISMFNIPVLSIFNFVNNFVSNPVLINKLNSFFFSKSQTSLSILHTFEYLLLMFYLLNNFNSIRKLNPNLDNIIKLFLCLFPLFTLLRNYEILTRFKDYFIFTYGVLLSYHPDLSRILKYRILKIMVILICAFGFFRFIMVFDNGILVPYRSYLFGDNIFFGN